MKIQFSVVLCAIFLVSAYAPAVAGPKKNKGASEHLHSLDCTEDQIAKYDGTRWICADEASGSCAVSADLGITTIACADGSSASIPPILAVAFINDDGQPGYLAGVDTLIAGLFDANFDGVPSVGDIIKLDQYPLDLDAIERGEFLTKTHVVTSPCPVSSGCQNKTVIAVTDGIEWSWSVRFRVTNGQLGSGDFTTVDKTSGDRSIWILDGVNAQDRIQVFPGPPQNANTAVDVVLSNVADGAFIDVNIFIDGELVVDDGT